MKLEKQQKYCRDRCIPLFAPLDGICFNCKRRIEDTDKHLLTGCSHCNMSWCD